MRFYALLILVAPVISIQGDNDVSAKELPDCSKVSAEPKRSPRELFIVSTLDGKISALDPLENGNLVWSHETGPGGLMSSSLSKLEMRSRGQWMRLVPSLDGSLYKFTGDTVEPVQMTADFLLKSSFKLGDDLVITGGKESHTYGIDLHTGQIHYVCTMSGCNQTEGDDPDAMDILVVKRNTQTVRAIEPRTGREKWNFSVGELEPSVLRSKLGGCQSETSLQDTPVGSAEGKCLGTDGSCSRPEGYIQVVVPEGLIAARNKAQGVLDWSVKFPSPVVGAWYLRDGELEPVNLFEQGRIIGLEGGEDGTSVDPVLYIGVHEKQLYVQHNIKRELKAVGSQSSSDQALSRVQWKPYLASAPSRTPIINTGRSAPPLLGDSGIVDVGKSLILRDDIVDYPFDTGYYLYESPELDNISAEHVLCDEEKEQESLDHYIIVSIWYWWKEVLAISIVMSLLVNLLITRHVLRRWQQNFLRESSSSKDKTAALSPVVESPPLVPDGKDVSTAEKAFAANELPKFESRYLSDFEPVRCLGKGGFGLVLESRNKIDDCTYAVKRICLPNSPEARDKVMREAKALAKLDHMGIVRYYNAWLESPPPGWQERQDDVWQSSFDQWSSSVYTDPDKASATAPSASPNRTRSFNPLQPFDPGFETSSSGVTVDPSLTSTQELPFQSYVVYNPDDSDSVVQFERSEGKTGDADDSSSGGCHAHRKRPSSLSFQSIGPHKVYLYIQMQLCKKESLKEWLHAHSSSREYEAVLDIFYQIVNAVEYVHEHGLIHRDLKPSNIFFAMDDAIKVGDFGLVTALAGGGGSVPATPSDGAISPTCDSGRLTDQVGTQLYMSPEQIDGLKYNQAVDIFSLGLIFFELLWPFSTQMERIHVLSSAKKLQFPCNFRRDYPSECELIEQLLSRDSESRPTAKDIKQHRLFQAFHPCEEAVTLAQRRRRNKSFNSSSFSE
ncbi:eukaryotic translation initiation factor 2-alpha kinase 3-like isoform X2 [Ornithodoros turicata]|uniref:eukaryotic translation initiation factor 2-alpha kinase 3-like isoform X2 n=1 Tax=Ornithodoros turicata TaxID=34597 RepID=UPI003139CB30